MNDREVRELAAILVEEHGSRAIEVAERRQAEHADRPGSELSRLWAAIRAATAQLLRRRKRTDRG
jgi:sugar (pentulose or hexulose) kinase